LEKKDEILVYSKEYHKQNKESSRWKKIKENYGITKEDYDGLFKSQGFVCAVCGGTSFGKNGPHVDHDHKANKVRGILCPLCNVGLGAFRDNVEFLSRAIIYLNNNS
jgi:hypothetical protein